MFIKLITSTLLLFHSTLMSRWDNYVYFSGSVLFKSSGTFPVFQELLKKTYMNYKQFSGSLFQSSWMHVIWASDLNAKFKYNCCLTFSLTREYVPWCEHFICLFPKHRTKIFTEHSCLIEHPDTSVQTWFFKFFFGFV